MSFSAAESPRFTARMAGLFALLMIAFGGIATLARRGIVVGGDAAATATNIRAHGSLYQLAFAGDVLVVASYVVVVALFYRVFKPVNRNLALVTAFFGVTACAVQAAGTALELAPLAVLGNAKYLSVFSAEQLQVQAYLFLRLYNQVYGVAIVFFAFFCLLTGYLGFTSTFMPRILGALMSLAGFTWLAFLAPVFATKYFAWIMPFAIGEGLFYLWLLVKGVNEERWRERANAAP